MTVTRIAALRNPAGQRAFITEYATEVMVQRELEEDELEWGVGQTLNTSYYVAAILFAAGMFSDYREETKLVNSTIPVLTVTAEHWEKPHAPLWKEWPQVRKWKYLGGI